MQINVRSQDGAVQRQKERVVSPVVTGHSGCRVGSSVKSVHCLLMEVRTPEISRLTLLADRLLTPAFRSPSFSRPLLVDVVWRVSHCCWMWYGGSPTVVGCGMEGLPLLLDVVWRVSHCCWMWYGGSPTVVGCGMKGLPLLLDVVWRVSHCYWMSYGGSPTVIGCRMEGLPLLLDVVWRVFHCWWMLYGGMEGLPLLVDVVW